MMYTFPNKLRNLAIVFMAVGFIGLVYGFISAPATIEEAKAIVAANHGEGHGTSHETTAAHATHDADASHTEKSTHADEASHATDADYQEETQHSVQHDEYQEEAHSDSTHVDSHDAEHDEHVFHQLSNKPWAALYVAAFLFLYDFLRGVGILCHTACRSSRLGLPYLYRVMEGITAYLLPGGVIVIVILGLSGIHFNHLFIWMDPEVVAHDKLIAGKTGFLNVPFFLTRAVIFLVGMVTVPLLFFS